MHKLTKFFDNVFAFILLLLFGIFAIFCLYKLILYFDIIAPPETIEKDGYTYILYEEPPEEFIEYNGHTYRLGDSVNE